MTPVDGRGARTTPSPRDASPHDGAVLGAHESGQLRGGKGPGWDFRMRPLRRWGIKGTKGTVTAPTTSPDDTDASKGEDEEGPRIESSGQADDPLEPTQTAGSEYGPGHVEALREVTSEDGLLQAGENREHGRPARNRDGDDGALQQSAAPSERPPAHGGGEFKVYKRRWFGVIQLVLLNTIVSWDVSAFSLTMMTDLQPLRPFHLVTDCCSVVAFFLCQLDDRISVLWGFRNRRQLAEHLFSLCLRLHLPPRHLHP